MGQRGTPKAGLVLSEVERETLERWARRPTSAQALALRCRIVLACAEGIPPTYSSWLNLVERRFAELTAKWLRRGTHRSVKDLVASTRT